MIFGSVMAISRSSHSGHADAASSGSASAHFTQFVP